MNRSERRTQEKQQRSSGRTASGTVHQRFLEARAHHQAGRLEEAARLYESILRQEPHHAEAAHLLGLVAYRSGQFEDACALIAQAISSDASQAVYHFNLGVVQQKRGGLEEAARAYRQAVTINPRYVEAFSNLGNVLKELGRFESAVETYRRGLAVSGSAPDLHNNLGVALKELERLEEAEEAYTQALRLRPDHVEARNNLGLLWMESGRLDDARSCFEQAKRLDAANAKSHYNLGLVSAWQGRIEEAAGHLNLSARLKHDHGRPVRPALVSRARLKHDVEQIGYLMEQGCLGAAAQPYLAALRRVRIAADEAAPAETWVRLSPADAEALAPSWNRILYPGEGTCRPAGALNPNLDVPAIEARWMAKRPEILYVDQLLTEEALAALRKFCWEATIWKKEYENGYLGAFIGDGFATPLLFQIAEELRTRFPRIFKDHRLTQSWSFKHDSARRGLGMHADAAAVNVNFWITSDEANLDPSSGGLVVWDREAPRDWNFKEYNSEKNRAKIQAFLEASGAQMVRIPYRSNRAVIFNSDLFHETDDVRFRDEYLCRRINVTLLYGFRARP